MIIYWSPLNCLWNIRRSDSNILLMQPVGQSVVKTTWEAIGYDQIYHQYYGNEAKKVKPRLWHSFKEMIGICKDISLGRLTSAYILLCFKAKTLQEQRGFIFPKVNKSCYLESIGLLWKQLWRKLDNLIKRLESLGNWENISLKQDLCQNFILGNNRKGR